ncbi:hypothetical protein TWF281_003173 [Arthrobotrys megalospora]
MSEASRSSAENHGDSDRNNEFRSREACRTVLDPGRTITGACCSKQEPIWGTIKSDTEAAIHWKQNLTAVMDFLKDRAVPWRVLHLGTLDGEVAVAILHDEDGDWDKETIEADLRRLFLPIEMFPRLEFKVGAARKGC